MLLEGRADADKATTDDGCTPMYLAAQDGHDAIVRALVEAKATVNMANKNNVTPLNIACTKGDAMVVQLLLEGKAAATINVVDDWGDTALSEATSKGHVAIVKLLEAHGATQKKKT